MPVNSKCPHCQAVFQVAREKIGLKAKCSKCGSSFRLSAMPAGPTEEDVLGAVAEMEEERGPFGLPRWTVPAVWLVVLIAAMGLAGYYTFFWSKVIQVGPSPKVVQALKLARSFVDAGQHELALPSYRNAIALAEGQGPEGREVVEAIQQELNAVKEDARLPLVLFDVAYSDDLAGLPAAPTLPRGHRPLSTVQTNTKPPAADRKQFLQVTCRIPRSEIGEPTTSRSQEVTEFNAEDFYAVDREGGRVRALGFKVDGRYFHRQLLIYPPIDSGATVEVCVVFAFSRTSHLQRVRFKEMPSTRVSERRYEDLTGPFSGP